LDDLKEARRYWKLKEEAQDRTLWRTHSLEEAMDLPQDRQLLELETEYMHTKPVTRIRKISLQESCQDSEQNLMTII
jgi:hypothetical protein